MQDRTARRTSALLSLSRINRYAGKRKETEQETVREPMTKIPKSPIKVF